MAKLLTDPEYAVRGRLVAVDNSGAVGPLFTLRIPPNTADVQRPASYLDFRLLDTNRKTLQKRIALDDELDVVIHAAAATVDAGTQREPTFRLRPVSRSQQIPYCRRIFESLSPINGKVVANDEHHTIVVDAGVPVVVTLLGHTPTRTRQVKVNAWVTFWPCPPTHGVVLGKA
ncbi:MAG: hypothetical protein KGY99_02060 [Phycisphaerae bacterium]|jgi:hypothetical protein|nr:hypothetical protein [Phycisphaerae bacterium]